jgi:endoglucanase
MRGAGRRFMIMILCGLLILTSCGEAEVIIEPAETIEVPKQMEEAPVLLYDVPVMYPSVFVNRTGYSKDKEKVVIVRGEYLPEVFRVVDALNGTVVYTGKLQERGFYNESEEYTGYGDFTEVVQAGTYYIECDVVGCSYPFEIGEGIERRIFEKCIGEMESRLQNITAEISRNPENWKIMGEGRDGWMESLLYLLLAYEIYPQTNDRKDTGQLPRILEVVEEGIQGLLYLQDKETGGVQGHSYLYASILAKYSYLYQQYDSVLANEILNLADRAWRYAEKLHSKQETKEDEEYRMAAAAELYRATGRYNYRNVFLEYGRAMEQAVSDGNVNTPRNQRIDEETKGQTLAKITYISTTQRVDVELCNLFIAQLMEEAEYIAGGLDQNVLDANLQDPGDIDRLFWNLIELSVVEYAITNHEYGLVLENQYQMLCGRNSEAYGYWSELTKDESDMRIREHPVWMAGFAMLLSEILTNG